MVRRGAPRIGNSFGTEYVSWSRDVFGGESAVVVESNSTTTNNYKPSWKVPLVPVDIRLRDGPRIHSFTRCAYESPLP